MNKMFSFMRESSTARFLIPVGIILIVFGAFVFVANTKNQNYVKIEATVTDVKEEEEIVTDGDGTHSSTIYNVTVSYEVDGKEKKIFTYPLMKALYIVFVLISIVIIVLGVL